MRTRLVVYVPLLALGASEAPAHAASVSVTPALPALDSRLTVAAESMQPGARGTARFPGAATVRFRVDARGRARVVVRLSRTADLGTRHVRVRAGRHRVSVPVTVVASEAPPSTVSALATGQRVVVHPAAGAAGSAFRLAGSGFRRRAAVSVRLGSRGLRTLRADGRGRFSIAAVVPAMSPGPKRLRVTARRAQLRLRFLVLARSSPTAGAVVPGAPPGPDAGAAPPAGAAPGSTAPPGPVPPPQTVVAAGDIACDPADPNFNGGEGVTGACRHRATSDVALAQRPAAVLGLGDMQYSAGAIEDFNAAYRPTWGRLDAVMSPVPGNHEYGRPGASGYFTYFGARAGPPGLGYYSFDVGAWHVIALNSNCAQVPCGPGSAQLAWLQADLAAHPARCTVAFFHHPMFGSGQGVNQQPVRPFWDALYAAGVELILNGHSHNYERFAPMTPDGVLDPARGVRQFTVGTGGLDLQAFLPGRAANSEARSATSFGVLVLTLSATGYSWRFAPAAAGTYSDSGAGTCHSGSPG